MRQLPLEITQPVLQRHFVPTNNACQDRPWDAAEEAYREKRLAEVRQLALEYKGPLASDRAIPGDVKERVDRNAGSRKAKEPVAAFAQRWIAEHQQVYALFVRFAVQVAARRKRFSAKAIVERLRWETAVQGGKDFKIPNAVTTYLALKFITEHPAHAALFKTTKRSK